MSVIFKCPVAEARWQATLKAAAEAQDYWRRTFQATTGEIEAALLQEARIRNQHQGNKP